MRKLSKEHIMKHIKDTGNIVSFASIFVSPKLTISDMEEVFKAVKSKPGRILVADMTTAKNGETVKDIEILLKYVDYLITNEKEAYILTGENDPKKSASIILEHGANTVIIKCGKNGTGLSKGLNLKNSCMYGCAAASVVVEHMGTRCKEAILSETDKRYDRLL